MVNRLIRAVAQTALGLLVLAFGTIVLAPQASAHAAHARQMVVTVILDAVEQEAVFASADQIGPVSGCAHAIQCCSGSACCAASASAVACGWTGAPRAILAVSYRMGPRLGPPSLAVPPEPPPPRPAS